MVELRPLRHAEHQPDAAGVEKRQLLRLEQKPQPQHLAIETHRPLQIVGVDRNLLDAVEGELAAQRQHDWRLGHGPRF